MGGDTGFRRAGHGWAGGGEYRVLEGWVYRQRWGGVSGVCVPEYMCDVTHGRCVCARVTTCVCKETHAPPPTYMCTCGHVCLSDSCEPACGPVVGNVCLSFGLRVSVCVAAYVATLSWVGHAAS